jgi:L-seryl-tRNA(Ser) seleniumtransferase
MAATGESVVHGSKARPQDLPSIDKLLRLPAVQTLVEAHGHKLVAAQARTLLDGLRIQAVAGSLEHFDIQLDALSVVLALRVEERLSPRMQRVINLTGTVIHTKSRSLRSAGSSDPSSDSDDGRAEQS